MSFAAFLCGAKVTSETIRPWKDDLREKNYAPSTINACLAALNGFFCFCGWTDCRARFLKIQRRLFRDSRQELTRGEYERLVAAAEATGDRGLALLMETICSTGIRVSGLQFITAEAVRRHKASIRCKGKCREILLPAELCHRLTRWCQKHRIHAGPVFLSRVGKPLSRVTVWKLLKALCERANVAGKKVFPHNLRHLFARTFYNLEKNISKLADLLGHSSIETTRIYIMESGAEHERLLNKMHLLL